MVKKESKKKEVSKKLSASNSLGSWAFPLKDVVSAINITYDDYIRTLTPRLKLVDQFLVFLVVLGILQFIYVLLIGNFPFNAFLGGFISCVGQFVLTVSLRLQYNLDTTNTSEDEIASKDTDSDSIAKTEELSGSESKLTSQVTPERAFGDYIFASLILHFTVYHFIN